MWMALALLAGPSSVCAADKSAPAKPDAAALQFFEQKIRPVLVEHCYECHSAKSAKKPRGGLRVDTRDGLLKGGDSGPAVVPGKPEESLLLKALRHEEVAMPPKSRLPEAVVNDFARWVALGLPDPRSSDTTTKTSPDADAGRASWAFQPPRRQTAPSVRDTAWPRSDVDRFILAALEAKNLKPARDAERATLLRRVTLDLTGLPPTPGEIDAFVADREPDAFAKVVDRLLASSAFGERWGRHWLDVARYADSNGKDENLTFHDAWRFRDYVVAAFNTDKPYDQFIREQLAGDLLPAKDQRQRDEQLIATGFLVVGPKMLFDRDQLKRKMDVVDEQIDTVGRAFLGLTLGCARCHDHKFDPIPTADYYALAGIFASTRTLDGMKMGNPLISGWSLRPLGADGEKARATQLEHEARIKAVTDTMRQVRLELGAAAGVPALGQHSTFLNAVAAARLKVLATEEARLRATAPPAPRLAMAVRDEDTPADVCINIRGNPHVVGSRVPRGFLRVASLSAAPKIGATASGRRELAEWLASKDHPLTARVFVNRVWLHLFGEGLVRSVDDFGSRGEQPTHPELLDHLAVRFVEEGWSLKKLVRALVLTRAYQLSAGADAEAARIDPENRLLGRANRRRLEAEVLRDALLTLSGQLDRRMGGSSVEGLGEAAINRESKGGLSTDDHVRRSVYLPVIRNELPPIFDVFDFANPDATTGKRNTTTVPTQALFMLNNPFVQTQARHTARRLLAAGADDEARLTLLYRRALGRAPTSGEKAKALQFLRDQRADFAADGHPEADVEAWAAVCQSMFGCTEFRFVE